MRVIRRAVADSLSFVGWKDPKTFIYPALCVLSAAFFYLNTAGRAAAEQEVSGAIIGLIAAVLAFGPVFVFNLVMAPIRLERELKAEAEKWLAKLNTQIRRNEELAKATASADAGEVARESVQRLSDEARELLLEAEKDKGGHVVKLGSMGGTTIQTNGRSFGEQGGPREQARWIAAMDELCNRGFLQDQGKGTVFKVTDSGYDMADTLTKPDKRK